MMLYHTTTATICWLFAAFIDDSGNDIVINIEACSSERVYIWSKA
jgi:hypothetical protein